jgi:hypothetical protein
MACARLALESIPSCRVERLLAACVALLSVACCMMGDNIRNRLQQLRLVLRKGDDTLSLANSVAYTIFGDRAPKSFVAWGLRLFDETTGLD